MLGFGFILLAVGVGLIVGAKKSLPSSSVELKTARRASTRALVLAGGMTFLLLGVFLFLIGLGSL